MKQKVHFRRDLLQKNKKQEEAYFCPTLCKIGLNLNLETFKHVQFADPCSKAIYPSTTPSSARCSRSATNSFSSRSRFQREKDPRWCDDAPPIERNSKHFRTFEKQEYSRDDSSAVAPKSKRSATPSKRQKFSHGNDSLSVAPQSWHFWNSVKKEQKDPCDESFAEASKSGYCWRPANREDPSWDNYHSTASNSRRVNASPKSRHFQTTAKQQKDSLCDEDPHWDDAVSSKSRHFRTTAKQQKDNLCDTDPRWDDTDPRWDNTVSPKSRRFQANAKQHEGNFCDEDPCWDDSHFAMSKSRHFRKLAKKHFCNESAAVFPNSRYFVMNPKQEKGNLFDEDPRWDDSQTRVPKSKHFGKTGKQEKENVYDEDLRWSDCPTVIPYSRNFGTYATREIDPCDKSSGSALESNHSRTTSEEKKPGYDNCFPVTPKSRHFRTSAKQGKEPPCDFPAPTKGKNDSGYIVPPASTKKS